MVLKIPAWFRTGVVFRVYPGGALRTESRYEQGVFTGETRFYKKNGELEKIVRDPGIPPKVRPTAVADPVPPPAFIRKSPTKENRPGVTSPGATDGGLLVQDLGKPVRPQSLPGGGGGFLVSTNGESIPVDLATDPGKLTVVVEKPTHGRLKDDGGGRFTYVPDPDFRGLDTFRVIPAPPGNPDGKIDVYVRTQPIDAETEILIITDMSGSMEQTWPLLKSVQANQLQRSLVRFYGSVAQYNDKVRVMDDPSERTLVFLQPDFPGRSYGKKITLVFQDEAHPHYHRSSGIYDCEEGDRYVQARPDPLDMLSGGGLFAPLAAMAEKDSFMEDITELRRQLGSQKKGFYRGVLFQIDNPVIPGFRSFVETVFEGRSPYTNSRLNLKEYTEGKFPVIKVVYGVSGHADPDTY
ncbi:MAG: hypothetical protein EBZ83_04370, partial [Verrucomicrobia bacterium]|nr:hypothetical protein [Verrucomicrobiota bacterium]